MKIEKRGLNSYRIRMTVDKKTYSVTVNHKPTEREAYDLILKKVDSDSGIKGTFKYYANEYIHLKENVISPRTVKEYITTVKLIPEWFISLDLGEIKASEVQRVINELAVDKSPKTVRNYHGFISAVFNMYRPGFALNTRLPQKEKHEDYIPTAADVKRILEYAKDTEYEVFLKLASMGLRRSEICALEPSDIEGNIVNVNKALVLDKNNKWIVKSTKTTASTRAVPISQELAEQIKKQGYVFKQSPNSVIKWLNRTQDALGIPRFRLHIFRHVFASNLMDMGVPSKTIMSLGGWETDEILKSIYQHNIKKDDEQKEIMSKLTDKFF